MGSIELGHRSRAGLNHVWRMLNDWWLNIDTRDEPEERGEAWERDGAEDYRAHYQGANYFYLEQIARLLTKNAPNQLVFYDIGCGKGRPLCVMARHPFRKVVGVEFRRELCEAARINAAHLRGRIAPISIVRGDAGSVDLSDGHVYFFFNPFGPPTMRRVLRSIERSLIKNPRDVVLVYYNAVHEGLFEATPWLEPFHILPTYSGVRVSLWQNRRDAS